MHHDALML
jgi:Arc/MetJ family transcription regulator